MSIYEHTASFAGKPVFEWDPKKGVEDPAGRCYRVGLSWDDGEKGESWTDRFSRFLQDPRSSEVTALVVGSWCGMHGDNSAPIVEALVSARDRLPRLTAIFLGDIISEENEISWITQSDVSPLFGAYPALKHFRVRGSGDLSFGRLRHARLKELAVESGGLDREIVHEVLSAELPELEHLELWLGDSGYGADATVEDLAPVLSGERFPKLRYLGLRDSEITDEICAVLANAAILGRIRVLDLSLGTLSDEGAAALLTAPDIRKLEKLDIHHHYCSDEMVQRLKGLGIEVDAGEKQEPDEWDGEEHRYVAVSE
jgi:hypothetical protein